MVNNQQMESSFTTIQAFTDKAIMQMVGKYIKDKRLQQNQTQQQTADAAGVDRTTLLKMENGSGGNMLSFIQVMRAIGELELVKQFEVREKVSPLLLAKMMRQQKQRASSGRKNSNPTNNNNQ